MRNNLHQSDNNLNLHPETTPLTPPKNNIKLVLFGILIGMVLTVFGIFTIGYFLVIKQPKMTDLSVFDFTPTPVPLPYLSPTPITINNNQLNPGPISWLQFPKPLKLDLYKMSEIGGEVKYHQIANFSDGSILINAFVPPQGPGSGFIQRFIKSADGKFYYLTTLNDNQSYFLSTLNSTVLFSNISIPELTIPENISTDFGDLIQRNIAFSNLLSFTELKNPQLLTTTNYGRIYTIYWPRVDLDVVQQRQFWLRLADDTVVSYDLNIPFMSDNQVPSITWLDGTKNTQEYNLGFRGGCGEINGKIIKKANAVNSFVKVGSSSNLQDVYAIVDKKDPTFAKIYESLDPGTRPSFEIFTSRHNHFLWQDKLGDWELFISTENQIQAECGKPVIYLYPTKDTQVSVKVGANITKSEPLYQENGWTVLAHPNGQLDYQKQTYPNLFWEGIGLGIYNSHRGEGFVVAQKNLISTLTSQLLSLGLNSQESADFMEFWVPKLPTTPYVRLTWLDTVDMNQLAPLQVYPTPKTVIRLFLDFEGLNQPVKLIPQKLSAPKRSGFTLVEWGGLLIK